LAKFQFDDSAERPGVLFRRIDKLNWT